MLKLKRLRVDKFRSLVRGTELLFSDGINIVLGQNGTGKTTLLDLISMVVRSDFSGLANEEFAIEYELSVRKEDSIVVLVRNEKTEGSLPETLSMDLGGREILRVSVDVLAGIDRRPLVRYDAEHGLSVGDSTVIAAADAWGPFDPGFLFFFLKAIPEWQLRDDSSVMLAGSALRLDESLDVFRRITDSSTPLPSLIITGPNQWLANPFQTSLVSNTLLQLLERKYQDGKFDYSFNDKELSWLAELTKLLGFHDSALRVDVSVQRRTMQLGNFLFRFLWEDGSSITQARLSYGQKRLLTFWYYIECNTAIVIADELVNGLHHRWITASIEAIQQRQAFLTSQNPLLLDYVPIPSPEVVRRSFVLCRAVPRDGRSGWIWDNMTEEDAEELYRAYQIGVEHVSEILQSRGLW